VAGDSLAAGTVLGALLAVAGVVVAKRSAGPLPAASDPAIRRRYGIIVGLEFGLLGARTAIPASRPEPAAPLTGPQP
jgi:hypothetical protein